MLLDSPWAVLPMTIHGADLFNHRISGLTIIPCILMSWTIFCTFSSIGSCRKLHIPVIEAVMGIDICSEAGLGDLFFFNFFLDLIYFYLFQFLFLLFFPLVPPTCPLNQLGKKQNSIIMQMALWILSRCQLWTTKDRTSTGRGRTWGRNPNVVGIEKNEKKIRFVFYLDHKICTFLSQIKEFSSLLFLD